MALFVTDLSTEANARRAMRDGGVACILLAVFAGIGAAMSLAQGSVALAAGCGAEMAIGLAGGWRLLRGHGVIAGSLAAAVMLVELAVKLLVAQAAVAVIAEMAMLAYTVNGVRAAWARRAAGPINSPAIPPKPRAPDGHG